MNIAKRLFVLAGPYRKLYGLAMIMSIVTMAVAVASPVVVGTTIDVILGNPVTGFQGEAVGWLGGPEQLRANLWIPLVLSVSLAGIRAVLAFLNGRTVGKASDSMSRDLQNRVYDHLQNLPYDYHVKSKTGDLIQRCTSDVENIRAFMAGQVMEIVRTTLFCSFIVVILLNLDPGLTLISVVVVPVIFASSFWFFKRMKDVFHQQDEMEGELFSNMQENLEGVRVVRAFGRSGFEADQFEAKNSVFRDLVKRFAKIRAIFWGSSDFLCFAQILLAVYFGIMAVQSGRISVGAYIIFVSYTNQLVWPLRNLARVLADMGRMEVSLDRIEEILNEPLEADTPGAVAHPMAGDIVFDQVSFAYGEQTILNNLSLTIHQGETIAILGSTGSGKSTIMHLLLRLYDYDSGSITINGHELKYIEKKHLRRQVGMVLQEPYLYSKTIEQNLKMSKDQVTSQEVRQATHTAKIHETIENFEKGYETVIGERGVTLSGGQRQRVSIARTIIKNSDILVFDDSLSAVDTETDREIRQALKERQIQTTTIIISGRISTLKEADRIFILENGQVTDVGNHEELINRPTLYKKIWDIQTSLEEELGHELETA